MRRRVLEHIPPARPSASSSSAPAGCATWSSPCSCCRWCTAGPTSIRARPTTLSALAQLTRGGLRRPRGRRRARRRPTGSCARSSTACSSSQLRRTHVVPEDEAGRCARSAASMGLTQGPGRRARPAAGGGTAARCAGCTRSSSTARCSPPSPSCPATRSRLSPKAAKQRLAALGYDDPVAALRHLEALTSGVSRTRQHPAHAAAGDARVVRRRAQTPTPGCSASGGSPTRSARRTGTSRRCATRARSPSGSPPCSPPAATPPTCSSARPRGCACSARTTGWCRASRDGAGEGDGRRGAAAQRPGRRRSPRSGRSGGASCSGSRSPTCSASSTPRRSGYALTDVTLATLEAALARRDRRRSRPSGAARCRPGWRSSRWAGSAGTSSASAATPT